MPGDGAKRDAAAPVAGSEVVAIALVVGVAEELTLGVLQGPELVTGATVLLSLSVLAITLVLVTEPVPLLALELGLVVTPGLVLGLVVVTGLVVVLGLVVVSAPVSVFVLALVVGEVAIELLVGVETTVELGTVVVVGVEDDGVEEGEGVGEEVGEEVGDVEVGDRVLVGLGLVLLLSGIIAVSVLVGFWVVADRLGRVVTSSWPEPDDTAGPAVTGAQYVTYWLSESSAIA